MNEVQACIFGVSQHRARRIVSPTQLSFTLAETKPIDQPNPFDTAAYQRELIGPAA